MISSDVIRGYNDTIILYLLQQNPSYGYEISKQIRTISEEKYIIKETTLYSAFTRMEKNGYIESFSGNETNGKRRTYYRVTLEGMAYYEEKSEKEAVGTVISEFGNLDELAEELGIDGFVNQEQTQSETMGNSTTDDTSRQSDSRWGLEEVRRYLSDGRKHARMIGRGVHNEYPIRRYGWFLIPVRGNCSAVVYYGLQLP